MNMKNMKQARQQGFTLIELMIVIAIVGILSAVALPAYQDYTVRARVAEVLSIASGFKSQLVEYHAINSSWPATGLTDLGYATDTLDPGSEYAGTVSLTANTGALTVQIDSTGSTAVDGGALTFTPTVSNGSVSWVCTTGIATTEYSKLPDNCRNAP
jgi:type IV pilus assembly protein PilA